MRWLLFSGTHRDFDIDKACGFQPLLKLAVAEAQPSVPVKFAGLCESVFAEVQNHDLSARFEYTSRPFHCHSRVGGVVEGLA